MITNEEFMAALEAYDKETEEVENSLWPQAVSSNTGLENSEGFKAIVKLLNDNPIIVGATLQWLNTTLAELSLAQLQVLYPPDQLQKMLDKARETEGQENEGSDPSS